MAGRGRGRPPKGAPKSALAPTSTQDQPDTAKRDRDGLDAKNILTTKRKIKKRPYDNVSDSDEAVKPQIPVVSKGKKTRFDIDDDYEEGTVEDFEGAIEDTGRSFVDDDEPLTPIKVVKGPKTCPSPKGKYNRIYFYFLVY
jgi:hypothetical protein